MPVNLIATLAWQVVAAANLPYADQHKNQLLNSIAQRLLRALVLTPDVGALLVEHEQVEARLQQQLEPVAAEW
ncbi:MAG: hypothetical protein IV092_26675 [Burkholderiaceae bacterium]|nr:hypothetical protein [Burkholderiaceae bacterium]